MLFAVSILLLSFGFHLTGGILANRPDVQLPTKKLFHLPVLRHSSQFAPVQEPNSEEDIIFKVHTHQREPPVERSNDLAERLMQTLALIDTLHVPDLREDKLREIEGRPKRIAEPFQLHELKAALDELQKAESKSRNADGPMRLFFWLPNADYRNEVPIQNVVGATGTVKRSSRSKVPRKFPRDSFVM